MTLPAKNIPESVAHLDMETIEAALIRNDASIRNAARDLNVPSGDLRKLVLLDQRLKDVSTEAVELQLDECEANLREGLRSDDPKRRDAISMFFLRNVHRAAKRGYAVAASAASLEMTVNANAEPVRYIVRWQGEDEADDGVEMIERDGKQIPVPRYGKPDDCLEGEVTQPAVMIEHQEPEPAAIEEPEPVVEPAVVEPPLLKWHDPYSGPPPLVAHLYQPHVPRPRGGPPQPIQPRKIIYE